MPDTSLNPSATTCDGGFRIDSQPNELTVTADRRAWKARKSSVFSSVMKTMLVLCLIVLGVQIAFELNSRNLLLFAFLAVVLVPSLLFAWLGGTNNIHCTRENLEVIRLIRGHQTGRWIFPRALVKQITFKAVSYSRYGSTFALVFTVEGKKVKVLRGIETPEAQTVLRALKRLGFDVVIDVGMPMAAEMALERRASWLA